MVKKQKEIITEKCKRLQAEVKNFKKVKLHLDKQILELGEQNVKIRQQKLKVDEENIILKEELFVFKSKKHKSIEDIISAYSDEQSEKK